MGLDTFPLLQNHTYLITYNNNVFKLKLEYQEISQESREAFSQVVSERAAHCQIEDVCRAVLYNIEREDELSPIQTDNFIIYPEVCKWSLGSKVLFTVSGKQLNCHKDLICLKIICKDVEKVQASISPTNKRNLQSCRLSQMPGRRAISNNLTKKTTRTLSHEDINTDNVSAPLANSSVQILDTPALGTDNIKGGQSLKSNNRITTLIEKHCSRTQTATSDDYNNYGLNRNLPAQDILASETQETINLSDRSKHQQIKEPSRKQKNSPLMVNLINTGNDLNACTDTRSSENNCSENTDHIGTNFNHSKRTKQAINVMKKINTIQGNRISDSELSDDSGKQVNKDIPHSHASKGNDELCNCMQLRDRGAKKDRNIPKMVSSSESLEKNNVPSTFRRHRIMKYDTKYLILQTKRRKLCDDTHGRVVKNLKAAFKDKGSKDSNENKKYQGAANEIQMCCNSLKMLDKSAVEMSDDSSIIYESQTMDDLENVKSVASAMASRNQNGERKNCSSSEDSELSREQLRKCYIGLSPESDDVMTSDVSNAEKRADQTIISKSGLPRKMRGRAIKTHTACTSVESSVRTPISKDQQLKVKTKLERHTKHTERNIASSFMSVGPHISNNRKDENSALRNSHIFLDVTSSSVANQTRKKSRKARIHVKRAVSDTPVIFNQSLRIDKEYNTNNESCSTKRSSNRAGNQRKNIVDVTSRKKITTGSHREIINNNSAKNNSSISIFSKRTTRSLSGSPSQQETKLFSRILPSKRRNLSPPEINSKLQNTPTSTRKLHEAQQHLIKSKDGVWLF